MAGKPIAQDQRNADRLMATESSPSRKRWTRSRCATQNRRASLALGHSELEEALVLVLNQFLA